ncbi:hypothetical protein HPP92_023764 [Vanilla planifolia]|uniref:Uncharacterized protein n=1 Tax=Vanilla planifolia TaxID=51239 RepID=A0A835PMY1_VANPL|nr:hypothetical protein HPP92_023764 [Vanilla planifolia]
MGIAEVINGRIIGELHPLGEAAGERWNEDRGSNQSRNQSPRLVNAERPQMMLLVRKSLVSCAQLVAAGPGDENHGIQLYVFPMLQTIDCKCKAMATKSTTASADDFLSTSSLLLD